MSRISPLAPLTLTFARPVSAVLGSRLPRLEPAMPGHWEQVDANTLSFRPAGLGFGLGGTVHVSVPGRSISWHVGDGSMLRLQEILARLGYLPVRWRAPAGIAVDADQRSGRRGLGAARHVLLALRGHADLAPGPVEARQLERRHRRAP